MPRWNKDAGRPSAALSSNVTDGAAYSAVQLGDWNAITSSPFNVGAIHGCWRTCKPFAGPVT